MSAAPPSKEPPAAVEPAEARVICGDAIDAMSKLPAGIAQTCVTSPPYWGLRDYEVRPRIWGGDRRCRHRWDAVERRPEHGRLCRRCAAWKGGLGLEPDPGLYVEHLVEVMREVRRVLRPDGTLWLNLGDSYAKGGSPGAKPKDLLGIPWRVALALRADGWWLRCDVIWAKANPTPEPMRDRPAHTHEYVFLLAPSRNYLYDALAVREPNQGQHRARGGRNRRSVWALPTAQFPGAHFAAFPEALVEPCVLAGSSPTACRECGAPWRRVVSSRRLRGENEVRGNWTDPGGSRLRAGRAMRTGVGHSGVEVRRETLGWEPTCGHEAPGGRCTVLDPFAGTGTTGIVAARHGRDFLGVELSGRYARIARRRISDATDDASAGACGDASGDARGPSRRPPIPRRVRPCGAGGLPKSLPPKETRP